MRNEKKEILNDFVFPSMANILFFFEALAEDEDFNTESKNKKNFHLREVFRDDIKELLGIKRLNPKSGNYAFVFTSLLHSIYKSYYPRTSDKIDTHDYTIRLLKIQKDLTLSQLRMKVHPG